MDEAGGLMQSDTSSLSTSPNGPSDRRGGVKGTGSQVFFFFFFFFPTALPSSQTPSIIAAFPFRYDILLLFKINPFSTQPKANLVFLSSLFGACVRV